MNTRKKILWWIVAAVSVLLMVWGGVRLISYFSDLASSRRTTEELREIAAVSDETGAVTATPEITSSPVMETTSSGETPEVSAADIAGTGEAFAVSGKLPAVEYPNGYEMMDRIKELRKKSEYIIGWITMDDLDEPVVHKDNTFFLDHDAMGKKNGNGAIFMDQNANLLTRPYTILLYGHNMKTGAMFGNLRKYEDPSYCLKHRLLQFDTLYEEGKYEIFAVETISLTPGKAKFLDLNSLQSSDRNSRKGAVTSLKNGSIYQSLEEVTEEDQILLLITCVGDDDERLVIAAKRLD